MPERRVVADSRSLAFVFLNYQAVKMEEPATFRRGISSIGN